MFKDTPNQLKSSLQLSDVIERFIRDIRRISYLQSVRFHCKSYGSLPSTEVGKPLNFVFSGRIKSKFLKIKSRVRENWNGTLESKTELARSESEGKSLSTSHSNPPRKSRGRDRSSIVILQYLFRLTAIDKFRKLLERSSNERTNERIPFAANEIQFTSDIISRIPISPL